MARRTRSVDERRILAVDGGGLAVGVGFVLVGIEHLNFVESHQKNAAVAAILAFALWRNGFGKLHVQLAIAEGRFCVDVAGFGHHFEIAVFHFPLGGGAVFIEPLREIFSVEEHDGVGGRFAGRVLSAGGSGSDDRRHGAIEIVDFPFGVHLGLGRRGGEQQYSDADKYERTFFMKSTSVESVRDSSTLLTQKKQAPWCERLSFDNRGDR